MRSGSSERASVAAAAKAAEGWPLPGSTPGSAALLWSPPRIRRGWHGNGDGQGGPPFEREPFARIVPAVAVAFPPPTGPAANARGLPDAREEPGPAPALSPSRPSSLPGTGSSCAADYRRRLEAVRERRALLRDSPDRRWPVVAKAATATDAKAKEAKATATNATTNAPRGRPDRDGYRPHSLPLHHHHPFPPRTNGTIGRNLSPGKPWHRTGAMVGDGPKEASGNLSAVVASSTGSPLCNDRSLPDGKSRNESQDDSKDNTGIDNNNNNNNNNNSRQGHGILERRSDGQHPFPAEAALAATGANGHRGSTHHHRAPAVRPHTKRARSSLRRVLCRPPEPAVDTGFAQIWGTQEAGGGVLRERPVSSGARPGADPWYKRPAGTGGGRDHPFERVMHVVWFVTEPEQ